MQLVSAFSQPQTVPPVPVKAPNKNLWILSSWRDLILYVGTPLLLVPMFALAQTRWSAQDIYLFVAAFGAMGHHLPGMIRAYGDRFSLRAFQVALYSGSDFPARRLHRFYLVGSERSRARCLLLGGLARDDADLRILPDLRCENRLVRGLDPPARFRHLCDLVCGGGAAFSSRMTDTLRAVLCEWRPLYSAPVSPRRAASGALCAIAVSILFLLNFSRMWVQGNRPNPVKLALLATSISFWWFCNNGVTNILAGIALFEVFHDVQYLSLVWIYNRNRVEKDSSIGGFMRFVFRRSGSLVGLYVGLVFAYGSLGYFSRTISTSKRSKGFSPVWWRRRACSIFIMMGLFGRCASALPVSHLA